jgi:hypothetical protein
MPEVLTNQHADSSVLGIERPHALSGGEEPPLVKQTVGRQVHLPVNVDNLAGRKVGGGDIEQAALVGLDKPHHDINLAALPAQRLEDRLPSVRR